MWLKDIVLNNSPWARQFQAKDEEGRLGTRYESLITGKSPTQTFKMVENRQE